MDATQPDFRRIEDILRRIGVGALAAEVHGSLCGLLCASEGVDAAAWAAGVLRGTMGAPQDHSSPLGEVRAADQALLVQLHTQTVAQINDANYGFDLLLPEDDEPLVERAEALSQWCQGFLLGLGLGGIQDHNKLPGDAGEIIRDLADISRLGHSGESGEDEETAYAEIVEYVRMGVLLVFEELRPSRTAKPDGGVVH